MARLAADDWIRVASLALAEGGVANVRIEPLAKRLGVTKGSFYWHFDDRNALLRAVVAAWESYGTERVIYEVDDDSTDPVERLHRLAQTTFFGFMEFDAFETNMRTWAQQVGWVAEAVDRIDSTRVAYGRDLLIAAGIDKTRATMRSQMFYRALIGEFVWRSHGGKAISEQAVVDLVESLVRMDATDD